MFNATQTQMMNTLGIVSDSDRSQCYDSFCEIEFEHRANGIPGYGSFTNYLKKKVDFAVVYARMKNTEALARLDR